MLHYKSVEPSIATGVTVNSSSFTNGGHLHIRNNEIVETDAMYSQLISLFYTFYTSLGNSKPDRTSDVGIPQCGSYNARSVESVETQVDGHVLSRRARVGMCRR